MVHAVHTGVYDRVHNMQISKIQNEGMKNFCKKNFKGWFQGNKPGG